MPECQAAKHLPKLTKVAVSNTSICLCMVKCMVKVCMVEYVRLQRMVKVCMVKDDSVLKLYAMVASQGCVIKHAVEDSHNLHCEVGWLHLGMSIMNAR